MNKLLSELIAMPINIEQKSVIAPEFKWEIYKYVNVYIGEDVEVEDVCYDVTMKPKVPKISFVDYLELLHIYKKRNWYQKHYVASVVIPFDIESPYGFWDYFDQSRGNLLYDDRRENKVTALYFIEEFEQYAIILFENKKRQ